MDVSDAIYHKKTMIPKKNYFQVVDQLMTAMVSLPPPMMMDRASRKLRSHDSNCAANENLA